MPAATALNYRHSYHAGNFADVFKHVLLVMLIEALKQKPKPFAILDTHAGAGIYDLNDETSQKTGEWIGGIGRLAAPGILPPAVSRYLNVVRACQLTGGPGTRLYPGSPWLARQLLRQEDRLACCELHPEPLASLEAIFGKDRQVGIHRLDGFTGLKALLPPPERRGVVLIDPPYEQEQETGAVLNGLKAAQQRWPTGIYAIWYPVTPRAQHERFLKQLKASGIRRIYRAELDIGAAASGTMTGNGMVVIRPPWQFDREVEALLPWFRKTLGGEAARSDAEWLVGE